MTRGTDSAPTWDPTSPPPTSPPTLGSVDIGAGAAPRGEHGRTWPTPSGVARVLAAVALGVTLAIGGLALVGDGASPDTPEAVERATAVLVDAELGGVVVEPVDLGIADDIAPIGAVETISGITVLVFDDPAQAAHAQLAVAALGLPSTPDVPDAVAAPGERFVLGAGERLIVFSHDDLPYLGRVIGALEGIDP